MPKDIHKHHEHSHHHASMHEIESIVNNLKLDDTIKQDILNIYQIIADAESQAHGVEVSQIHFHEVGALDAIMDIAAACLLIRKLNPDRIIVSPICTGSGFVKCAHGVVPVPAPATAYILEGVPNYMGDIKGELCTPTGAAILKYFADEFGSQPVLVPEKTGYGFGKKDFERTNCLKAVYGESLPESKETVLLECNIDDMTGEELGYALERLQKSGALEVYLTPVYMKKNRPGQLLSVLCTPEKKEEIVRMIFKLTTTIGIREFPCSRYKLKRETITHHTDLGEVREKISSGFGVCRQKKEYEDLKEIAEQTDTSIREIREKLKDL